MRIPGRFGAPLKGRALALMVALASLPGAGATTAASAQDIFTVHDVAVDATGESAAQARDKAVAEGHVKAYQRLLQRLVPQASLAAAPRLSASELLDYVQGFRVAEEKTSDVRYLAELSFTFRPDEIRTLLARNGVPIVETRRKPVLLLPLFERDGELRLWDDPNPWRATWQRRPDDGLVPILTPLGDLEDIASIDAQTAASMTPLPLERLEARYGAEGVIVALAVLSGDPEAGDASLTVEARGHGLADLPGAGSEVYRQAGDDSLDDLLERAAGRIDDRVQEAWKRDNQVRYGTSRQIAVTVPLSGLDQWIAIQRRLRQTPTIQRLELRSLRRDNARLNLHFQGNEAQLGRALSQRDLALALTELSEWELRPAVDLVPVVQPPAPAGSVPGAPPGGAAPDAETGSEPPAEPALAD